MWRIILYGLLIWFLFNLVFRFIIPLYRAGKQMKSKFREMHDNMQEQMRQQQGQQPQPEASPKAAAPAKGAGDYIEFEEVK
ncbi:MAG TPA: hypothetical protein VK644_11875 [Chitinophagaceae bacterium]|nr:hypothetical protein [Chitinophagaceae bacterium]